MWPRESKEVEEKGKEGRDRPKGGNGMKQRKRRRTTERGKEGREG